MSVRLSVALSIVRVWRSWGVRMGSKMRFAWERCEVGRIVKARACLGIRMRRFEDRRIIFVGVENEMVTQSRRCVWCTGVVVAMCDVTLPRLASCTIVRSTCFFDSGNSPSFLLDRRFTSTSLRKLTRTDGTI